MYCGPIKLIVLFMILGIFKDHVITAQPQRVRRLYNSSKANWAKFNFAVAIVVTVHKKWRGHCTGSLITPDKVLTSAHCFFDRNSSKGSMTLIDNDYVKVAAGEKYWDKNSNSSKWSKVIRILVHEEYNSFSSDCDIAMVLLKESFPVDGKHIGLVEYWNEPPPEWAICEAAGWGLAFQDLLPKDLRSGSFVILPQEYCAYRFGVNSKNFLCGVSQHGSVVCSGDSGGPLLCDGKLSGIIDSSGLNCTMPSLFTNVANFKSWIDVTSQRSFANSLTFKYFKLSASCLNFILVYVLYIW